MHSQPTANERIQRRTAVSNYKHIVFFLFLVLPAMRVQGQEDVQGKVTIHADPRLGILLKKSRLIAAVLPENPAADNIKTVTPNALTPAVSRHETLQYRAPKTIYSGSGFRVQIYNGSDRNKAMKVKTDFMRKFPGVHSYIMYIQPGFRVKVGDFRTRPEAVRMLHEANKIFTHSMIVPDMVTVSEY
jgi:hypothetical protein